MRRMMSEQVSEPYFRFGEGRISGWISVIARRAERARRAVLPFPRFPDDAAAARQAYTADQMRWLLGAGMIFSAAFGL